jgi:hypothetical protein
LHFDLSFGICQFPFGNLTAKESYMSSQSETMVVAQSSQHERKVFSLSNKPLVKIVLGVLTAVSVGSCGSLAYLLSTLPRCDMPKAKGMYDSILSLSCSGKDLAVSLMIGLGSYAITIGYKPLVELISPLFESKQPNESVVEEDLDSIDTDEQPTSWLDFSRCLSSFMNCINLDDTNALSTDLDDEKSSKGSQKSSVLLIDAPVPNPRNLSSSKSKARASKSKVQALEKKKRTLERRLRTEAKFYALQERLSQLLARESPPDGDKEAPLREQVNKTRKTMLKLNERLEAVDKELIALQD